MARRCKNFIESFTKYLSLVESPQLYKTWAGITCISGALERRCWITNREGHGRSMYVYPTMMVLIMGETASGKSPPINLCRELWKAVPQLRIGEDSMTAAAFYDAIAESTKILDPASHTFGHPISIAADEMAAFFVDYDKELLAAFIQAYDCRHELSQRRRGAGTIRLDHPCLNLLLGGQPKMFPNFFPEQAFDQGFMRRVIVVYGEKKTRMPFFQLAEIGDANVDAELGDDLKHDLLAIANMTGPFTWTPDAVEKFTAWDSHREDWPTHPRMSQYNEHRTVNCAKIAMLLSAAESDNRIINLEHFNLAVTMLREVEHDMPKVLQATISDNDYRTVEATLDFIKDHLKLKGGKAVHESVICDFLIKHIKANMVPVLIEAMIGTRDLQVVTRDAKYGQRIFKLKDTGLAEEEESQNLASFASVKIPPK